MLIYDKEDTYASLSLQVNFIFIYIYFSFWQQNHASLSLHVIFLFKFPFTLVFNENDISIQPTTIQCHEKNVWTMMVNNFNKTNNHWTQKNPWHMGFFLFSV